MNLTSPGALPAGAGPAAAIGARRSFWIGDTCWDADSVYRETTEPFAARPASKWVGDCWLLALATSSRASKVTFDHTLFEFARKSGLDAVVPA